MIREVNKLVTEELPWMESRLYSGNIPEWRDSIWKKKILRFFNWRMKVARLFANRIFGCKIVQFHKSSTSKQLYNLVSANYLWIIFQTDDIDETCLKEIPWNLNRICLSFQIPPYTFNSVQKKKEEKYLLKSEILSPEEKKPTKLGPR